MLLVFKTSFPFDRTVENQRAGRIVAEAVLLVAESPDHAADLHIEFGARGKLVHQTEVGAEDLILVRQEVLDPGIRRRLVFAELFLIYMFRYHEGNGSFLTAAPAPDTVGVG